MNSVGTIVPSGTIPVGERNLPQRRGAPPAETLSGTYAAPLNNSHAINNIRNLLYQITGKNPFTEKDPERNTAIVAAFKEALTDGKISQDEFEDIMDEFYDISNVTTEAWEAFVGKKGANANVTLGELAKCLKFFQKFRSISGYSFGWFLDLDKIYIVGGKGLGQILKGQFNGKGLRSSSENPEVESTWKSALWLTGGKETPATWDWFGTILMTKYVAHLKDAFDFDELELERPLMRQLFAKKALRWVKTGEGMNDDEWDGLLEIQESIRGLEEEFGPLGDVALFITTHDQQTQQEERLHKAIALNRDELNPENEDWVQRKKDCRQLIGQLRFFSDPHAAPQKVVAK
ncbi:MAG: hypothetical protein KKA31_00320 [Candidatus Margulisbacteria bacterium]|nr:hypothetical protein [Candidatus Margulisiibacteriota bacterium]